MRGISHLYQRAFDKGVIFYTVEDRLVCYTIYAVTARRYGIKVLAAALMFTHLHQSVRASSKATESAYIRDASSSFARAYNSKHDRRGPLFAHRFGRSRKRTDKDIKTNLAYVANNHVEKRLCRSATESRWAFLPYALSKNPFSEPLDPKKASAKLQRSMRTVSRRSRKDTPLTYKCLEILFDSLSEKESQQLIDHIITEYAWTDYQEAAKYYRGVNDMICAFDSNTGSEYSIAEEFVAAPDTNYEDMLLIAEAKGFLEEIYSMDDSRRLKAFFDLSSLFDVPIVQFNKFLHAHFVKK